MSVFPERLIQVAVEEEEALVVPQLVVVLVALA